MCTARVRVDFAARWEKVRQSTIVFETELKHYLKCMHSKQHRTEVCESKISHSYLGK